MITSRHNAEQVKELVSKITDRSISEISIGAGLSPHSLYQMLKDGCSETSYRKLARYINYQDKESRKDLTGLLAIVNRHLVGYNINTDIAEDKVTITTSSAVVYIVSDIIGKLVRDFNEVRVKKVGWYQLDNQIVMY